MASAEPQKNVGKKPTFTLSHRQTVDPDLGIELSGLVAHSPLAFLSALGALSVASNVNQNAQLSWRHSNGAIRPILHGLGNDPEELCDLLLADLKKLSMSAFEMDRRLPFDADKFRRAVREFTNNGDTRALGFCAAFGSEVVRDTKKGTFRDTAFRMLRSGDSQGNGFPEYARRIRERTTQSHLVRSLFHRWDYGDGPPDFRWDPASEKPYAYDWKNRAESPANTMLGANSLALEALPLFPTSALSNTTLRTTAYVRINKQMLFSWPVWSCPASTDLVRAILGGSEWIAEHVDMEAAAEKGIIRVFRCRRFASSQYYSNFSPPASL